MVRCTVRLLCSVTERRLAFGCAMLFFGAIYGSEPSLTATRKARLLDVAPRRASMFGGLMRLGMVDERHLPEIVIFET